MSWPNPTMLCQQEPRGPRRSSGLSITVRSPLTNGTSPWMRCFPGLSGTTMVWMACSSWSNYHGQGFLKLTSTPGSSSASWRAKLSVRRSSYFCVTPKMLWCLIITSTNSGLTPTSIRATGMISSSSVKRSEFYTGITSTVCYPGGSIRTIPMYSLWSTKIWKETFIQQFNKLEIFLTGLSVVTSSMPSWRKPLSLKWNPDLLIKYLNPDFSTPMLLSFEREKLGRIKLILLRNRMITSTTCSTLNSTEQE